MAAMAATIALLESQLKDAAPLVPHRVAEAEQVSVRRRLGVLAQRLRARITTSTKTLPRAPVRARERHRPAARG
eukprot:3420537-Pleurochrysis_carterae.AAC.1